MERNARCSNAKRRAVAAVTFQRDSGHGSSAFLASLLSTQSCISPRTPRYKFDTPHEFQGRSVILTQPAEGPARRCTVSVIRMLTKSATYAGSLPRTLLILRHLAARASPHARGTVIAKRQMATPKRPTEADHERVGLC